MMIAVQLLLAISAALVQNLYTASKIHRVAVQEPNNASEISRQRGRIALFESQLEAARARLIAQESSVSAIPNAFGLLSSLCLTRFL